MSKFNVNDEVIVIATGEKGVVKAKETTVATDGSKHTTIQYMVKVGNGFSNWKVFYRRELQKVPKTVEKEDNHTVKVYDAPDGYTLTMVAQTKTIRYGDYLRSEEEPCEFEFVKSKEKKLNISYSICNPNDTYDEKIGVSIAKKRLRTRPFAHMSSKFSGEFNKETVEVIMDVKAKYIINNFSKFVSK
jgi:hypothetical protein